MSKYPKISVSVKTILAFFAATMMCAVVFALPVSAANWTAGTILTDTEYELQDVSAGIVTVADNTTLTVVGTGNGMNQDLGVILGTGSRLVWSAGFTGSGSLSVTTTGTGATAQFSGGVMYSDHTPVVTIGAGLQMVTFSGSDIGGNGGTTVLTASDITMTGGRITRQNAGGVGLETTANVTISGGTIEGEDGGVAFKGTNKTLTMTGGEIALEGNGKADYAAVHMEQGGTILISNGAQIDGSNEGTGLKVSAPTSVTMTNTGANKNIVGKTAVYTNSNLSINGGTIEGFDYGVHAVGGEVSLTDVKMIYNTNPTFSDNYTAIYTEDTATSLGLKDCSISTTKKSAVITACPTTIDNCIIQTTYTSSGSGISTVQASDNLLIKGANTEIKSSTSANESTGIHFNAPGKLLEIQGGSIYGTDYGIFHNDGDITISGGSVTATGSIQVKCAAISLDSQSGDVLTIRGGTIDLTSRTQSGIYVHYNSNSEIVMSGGFVYGFNAILVDDFNGSSGGRVTLSGGRLTGSGSGGAAVTYKGVSTLEIAGAELIGDGFGAYLGNASAKLKMTSGSVLGDNGIGGSNAERIEISGGTISGTAGKGITGTSALLSIAPAIGTSILVKGTDTAIDDSATTPSYNNIRDYITSESYDGSNPIKHTTAFVNDPLYKYIQFFGNSPVVASPSPEPTPTPGYSSPAGGSGTDTDNPRVPIYTSESAHADYIIVIATLNKSGVVNSEKTAKDIRKAHNYARQIKVNKILLKITAEGTGVSKSAMQKLFKAANGTSLYLTFDFHTKVEEQVLGNVFVPLNSKSGQYLTRIYFDSKRIESVQKDIEKRWKTTILGSFETAEKGGWNETATVTVNLNHLGFSADNGERLYALIYDTQTKKYYQAAALIKDGNVVITTKRSGIFTIVTDSIL